MDYKITGTTVPAVEIKLHDSDSVYTQSGGMAWRTENIEMATDTKGGFVKGFKRAFAGESMFLVTYTSHGDSSICFSSTVPGNIVPIDVAEHSGMVLQKGAFLCAESSVELHTVWKSGVMRGLFGGEGFIMQEVTGSGMLFLEVDGDSVIKELAPDETIYVSTGNVVAFDSTVTYSLAHIKGVKNILFSGAGFHITTLRGPGRIILQTQNIMDFADRIASMIPQPVKSNN